MTIVSNELTLREATALVQYEVIIKHGLKMFVEVGGALRSIRDNALYRSEFRTFEEYCGERWGLSSVRAKQLVDGALVAKNIETIVSINVTESQVRPLTKLLPEEQPIIWQRAVETAPNGKVTAAHVESVVKAYKAEQTPPVDDNLRSENYTSDEIAHTRDAYQLSGTQNGLAIHFSSDSPEHYTPKHILDLVLDVMGKIDLDPCSNSKTNPQVPATVHYTENDNGLVQAWLGSVFMNPPYGRVIGAWVDKLCAEFSKGNVTEAIALVPARVDTAWWDKLTSLDRAYPLICFVKGRLTFVNNADPAPFPSALVYLGDNRVEFYSVFSAIGRIWGAWNDEIAGLVDYGSS